MQPIVTILGCGFSGREIARHCQAQIPPIDVLGTRRDAVGVRELEACGIQASVLDGMLSADVIARLEMTTHLVSSVAPLRARPLQDPMLTLIERLALSGRLPRLRWIGYLSTIGVYGDHQAEWVDEDTVCSSNQLRSQMRLQAEDAWRTMSDQLQIGCCVIRLSGIYGRGRNVLEDVLAGKARRVIKPGHVFNRIHVEDIARFVVTALRSNIDGIFNVTDDEPAPSASVVEFACELLGVPAPDPIDFDATVMSDMALSFWAECKRVSNARSKSLDGFQYHYPNYRVGLGALAHELSPP